MLALGCVPTAPGVVMVAPEVRTGDCANAEQNVEFAPFMIEDFEATTGKATFMYTYTDNTSVISPTGYEAATEAGTHCSSDPGQRVFHFAGGPFLGWGGGLGVSMLHLTQGNTGTGLCGNQSPLPDFCIPPGPDRNITNSLIDASQWDGVALWARRGPNSQPLLRVLVGNKYTDDDISFYMYADDPTQPRYCERVHECACINNLTCTFADSTAANLVPTGGGYYCGLPGIVQGPDISTGSGLPTNTCNITRCNDAYPAHPEVGSDPAFVGRQCRPFTYRSGVTSSFCYDPDGAAPSAADPAGHPPDPPPAETDQQCGDHWTYPLHLTTDWQLYLVPFNSMYQQGFAKKFSSFDLKSVSVVRLTWDSGPVDFYIDNWRFYRVKRPSRRCSTRLRRWDVRDG